MDFQATHNQMQQNDTMGTCYENDLVKHLKERVQKMLQERKEKEKLEADTNDKKPQEIEWHAIHPDRPLQEGMCPICRGDKVLVATIDGNEYTKNCVCVEKKIVIQRLKNSGIAESVKKYHFNSFQTPEEWQKRLKQKALQFLDEKEKWFFVGGQVGCGKTHICTAILGEFLNKGKSARYILWTNEVVKLKANRLDDVAYQMLIEPMLKTEVLYIDDLFKTEKGKKPSEADIRIAFEILNYRYINSKLITIISCEKTIGDLIEIDEAVGSRIYEKAKGYATTISQDQDRNWRLRK